MHASVQLEELIRRKIPSCNYQYMHTHMQNDQSTGKSVVVCDPSLTSGNPTQIVSRSEAYSQLIFCALAQFVLRCCVLLELSK